MRGIKKLHARYPIRRIRDAGVPGTTITSSEYLDYMDLRRRVQSSVIDPQTRQSVGTITVRWMNSHYDDLSGVNDQSIVMKVENGSSSALLAGDTSFRPWKEKIVPFYANTRPSSSILLASHHGSLTFYDDPADDKHYYTMHMQKIRPAMTVISVGPNVHGLPDAKAVELYEKYSSGSSKGNKVFRTDREGNIRLVLRPDRPWTIYPNQ